MPQLITAILDSREPPWVKALDLGVPKMVMALDAGDAWLSTDDGANLVVERKTLADLLGSIADGRLFMQTKAMVNVSPWSYVVVTGHPVIANGTLHLTPGADSGWKWKSVQGALLTVQEMGVGVVWREADNLYLDALQWLASRPRDPVRAVPRRESVLESEAERILCALPGISTKLAQVALMVCGTPALAIARICSLLEETDIPGIAKGKRAQVRNALGLGELQHLMIMQGDLTVIDVEDAGDSRVYGRIVADDVAMSVLAELLKDKEGFSVNIG